MLPLKDIVVLEMAGLAPAPFAGLILSDFGANVIRIDRPSSFNTDVLTRGKRSVALNLKNKNAIDTLLKMCDKADILLDPFRPGVMESLGLGPEIVLNRNPRLIYARLSGYGQTGSKAAGHDINYLAMSGALNMIGRQGEAPFFPMNLLADFAGGGLLCVMGILVALIERSKSGKGQVVDANLTAGTSYLSTFPFLMQKYGLVWEDERGTNTLDGGAHFYETYKTKDDLYIAVGAIEPHFYSCLLDKLGLDQNEYGPKQYNKEEWPMMKKKFQEIFLQKTQSEWNAIFDGSDACVTPVLSFQDKTAPAPQPAPVLSRTPAHQVDYSQEPSFLQPGKHSIHVLKEFGISSNEIQALIATKSLLDKSSHL
ncbi:CoA-transferase family III [Rhizopus microsporus var. microsporus]|uniref:Alpha-methylacyl-CoA racemase n=2 Tax=Rhizopus microsporus TaxID=58291 RepID=A0A2G4STG6_RHIZD|nr:alpha-methylacyl-CoA racemase [Rhizopus microsporus ATCC 52813]ORE04035.1 CoA-transferase family III [Rhizopus microsporus var. microsporus]PHZ12063.1 alpha-methylacyl-CoA racemase [Rhizopus microsporus ATCC 52813]